MEKQMAQSKSSDVSNQLSLPKRTFTAEFWVGLFALITLICTAWLSVGLAGIPLLGSNTYVVYAEFDNISGLKKGASVEIAGVPIGEVSKIELNDPSALISLKINKDIKIKDDDIASIRTKGLIGDRYVRISRGASDTFIKEGQTIFETESIVDIEDLLGKVIHGMNSDEE
jgi:phospholipid/cholesterol/gamma-HCH transport system substrate-binding protein